MIFKLKPNVDSDAFISRLRRMGLDAIHMGRGKVHLVGGIDASVDLKQFSHLPEVEELIEEKKKYTLASKSAAEKTIIEVRGKKIGGEDLFVIAGPCSIESKEQIELCAKAAFESGAQGLRGGAFKPRTSPYEFQGMGEEGLQILKEAADRYDLVVVSEVMDAEQIEVAVRYVDILQIGARNMQNFTLLKAVGKTNKPVLLKRGFSATYQDLLLAAEYIMSSGNPNVILCERGIRTFETYTRNTLDLNAVPALKELTHLPILVDPSHGTGRRSMVVPMAKASVAAGADGLVIEMHPHPDLAITDAAQTIDFQSFHQMMQQVLFMKTLI